MQKTKNGKDLFAIISLVLILAAACLYIGISEAKATTSDDSCVPSEEWTETITIENAHWQRYSWTGGPHTSDDPPAFPSSDWQPNVKGDPHKINVPGPYFRSHGNSGNGDWFYLEWVPAITETVHHDAVICDDEPEEEEEQEYLVCVPGWDNAHNPHRVTGEQNLQHYLENGAKLWTGGDCWPEDPEPTDEPTPTEQPTDEPTPTEEPTTEPPVVTDPPVTEVPTEVPSTSVPDIGTPAVVEAPDQPVKGEPKHEPEAGLPNTGA